MKKILVLIILCFVVLISLSTGVFAKSTIFEVNDLNVLLEGELVEFQDTPININQRTLLPIRELLAKMGVQNDDEHIIWNSGEKSVTVYKDDIKIYLKVNSDTAYINDVPKKLDTTPIIYSKNSRTYIPARFVCEALGSKVGYDVPSKTVMITNAQKYSQIEKLLKKSDEAMKDVKYKATADMDIVSNTNGLTKNMGMDMDMKVDNANQRMKMEINMSLLGLELTTTAYYEDNASYIYNPIIGTWNKTSFLEFEYENKFYNEGITGILESRELICSSLHVEESENQNEILLAGDLHIGNSLNELLQSMDSLLSLSEISKYKIDEYKTEIHLDKNTYVINSITMKVKVFEDVNSINMDIKILYSDYNGDFEIVVPDEVKEGFVESITTDPVY